MLEVARQCGYPRCTIGDIRLAYSLHGLIWNNKIHSRFYYALQYPLRNEYGKSLKTR